MEVSCNFNHEYSSLIKWEVLINIEPDCSSLIKVEGDGEDLFISKEFVGFLLKLVAQFSGMAMTFMWCSPYASMRCAPFLWIIAHWCSRSSRMMMGIGVSTGMLPQKDNLYIAHMTPALWHMHRAFENFDCWMQVQQPTKRSFSLVFFDFGASRFR